MGPKPHSALWGLGATAHDGELDCREGLPASRRPMTNGTVGGDLEKRLAPAHRLALAFFARIIRLTLVGQLANLYAKPNPIL